MLKTVKNIASGVNLFRSTQISMNVQSRRTVQMSTSALKMPTVQTRIQVILSGATPVSVDEDSQATESPVTQVNKHELHTMRG